MVSTCVCFPSVRSMRTFVQYTKSVDVSSLFGGFGTQVLVTTLVLLRDEKVPSTTELSKANRVLNAADG